MSKTILLIENDAPFAEEISGGLEAMGYLVRVVGDGKDGLELARDLTPDAIVLCVELPKLSGYSICNKLKRDDDLKSIPLILTSSEATEEVFEDHKKLKVRAEAYLIKPYVSAALLEKLAALIGMPEASAAAEPRAPFALDLDLQGGDEEVVSLEEDLGPESLRGEPGQELPALDLDSLPDEPAAVATGDDLDDDLKLLDDAFDGLSAPVEPPAPPPPAQAPAPPDIATGVDAAAAGEAIEKALGVERPVTSEDLEAASASLPEDHEAGASGDLGNLAEEADLALDTLDVDPGSPATSAFDALDALDEPAAAPPRSARSAPAASPAAEAPPTPVTPSPSVAFGLASVRLTAATGVGVAELAGLETELADPHGTLHARDAELRELRTKLDASARRADKATAALGEKDVEATSLKARAESLAAQASTAEADAKALREEARRTSERAHQATVRAERAEAKLASAEGMISAAEGRCRAAEQEAASQRRAVEQSAVALAAKAAELASARASAARLAEVERDVERLETELVVARGEVEGARSEVERRAVDLKRRVAELEAANSRNEERVVKAYLKIKGDEKVRDKARKALAIALQLLEEGLPAAAPPSPSPPSPSQSSPPPPTQGSSAG